MNLNDNSRVIEIASNDGYLLKNFIKANVPCIGIEPTLSTAREAEKLNIPVIKEFFSEELGRKLAKAGQQADLIIGNNVFAHVPDINNFTLGLKHLLKKVSRPHLMLVLKEEVFVLVCTLQHQRNLTLLCVK